MTVSAADVASNKAVAAAGLGLPYGESISIGGMISPGKVTVKGLHRESDIDERKGYGLSGATSVPRGDKLARCTLHFEFWEDQQFVTGGPTPGSVGWTVFYAAWFQQVGVVVPGGAVAMGLGISHPVLNAFGVNFWLVADRTGIEYDEYGLAWCDIHLKEFRKPLPAPQKPIAAIPTAKAPTPTAQDALDAQIESVSAQNTAIANSLLVP